MVQHVTTFSLPQLKKRGRASVLHNQYSPCRNISIIGVGTCPEFGSTGSFGSAIFGSLLSAI